ncbi:MAG: GIY-YIG nuclease family protein [Candidatus Omnitrophica bacterium]|nr:GIY-YIG nuclease family protein [Candidatus Omnitrophota bacterium]
MWYTYILLCSDQSLYVGSTSNVLRRFEEHSTGHGGDYTRQRLPLKLIHSEKHVDKTIAENREAQIKRWTYRKKLALVEGNLGLLKKL